MTLAKLIRDAADAIDEWAPDSGAPSYDEEVKYLEGLAKDLREAADSMEKLYG